MKNINLGKPPVQLEIQSELSPLSLYQLYCPLTEGFLDKGPTFCLYGGLCEPPPCCHQLLLLILGHLQEREGIEVVNKRDTEIRITSHSTPDQQPSVNETYDDEAITSMQSEFTISN